VRTHFKDWTKNNPPNNSSWEEWKPFYSPLQHIHNDIYNTLLLPISITELTQTINLASKGKATGPSGIANEVLQQLSSSALTVLLNIFNSCIIQEIVPDQWLQANVWPIPKKQHYNYELNTTRP